MRHFFFLISGLTFWSASCDQEKVISYDDYAKKVTSSSQQVVGTAKPTSFELADTHQLEGTAADSEQDDITQRFEGFLNFEVQAGDELFFAGPFPFNEHLPCNSPEITYQSSKPTYQDYMTKNLGKVIYCLRLESVDDNMPVQYFSVAFSANDRVPSTLPNQENSPLENKIQTPTISPEQASPPAPSQVENQTPTTSSSGDSTPTTNTSSCPDFPLRPEKGTFVYSETSEQDPPTHPASSKISDLKCSPGYSPEGFTPMTCENGQWKGEMLGVCIFDKRLSVTLQGPLTGEASFYIYFFLNGERAAGYFINADQYAIFKDKRYPVNIEENKAYEVGIECGDFRLPAHKAGAFHRKYISATKLYFSAGEQLTVTCGDLSSNMQGVLPMRQLN